MCLCHDRCQAMSQTYIRLFRAKTNKSSVCKFHETCCLSDIKLSSWWPIWNQATSLGSPTRHTIHPLSVLAVRRLQEVILQLLHLLHLGLQKLLDEHRCCQWPQSDDSPHTSAKHSQFTLTIIGMILHWHDCFTLSPAAVAHQKVDPVVVRHWQCFDLLCEPQFRMWACVCVYKSWPGMVVLRYRSRSLSHYYSITVTSHTYAPCTHSLPTVNY